MTHGDRPPSTVTLNWLALYCGLRFRKEQLRKVKAPTPKQHTHKVTVRVAVFVELLYEPEIVTVVDTITGFVVIVKVALVDPAGMVTLLGTVAAEGLLLESETCAPPTGAGPFSVTVPVDDPTSGPPITLFGFTDREETMGGTTVSAAVFVPPP
jgi:hypothetical protein